MTTTADLGNAALRALVCLDLTNLDDGCTAEDVAALCRKAQTPQGSVAAVCVWPRFVADAKAALAHTGVRVATVVNFPTGTASAEATAAEAREAIAAGADEIDMVVPWQALQAGDEHAVTTAVEAVKAACGDATLKAILETGALGDPAAIGLAAERALSGGADFLKTSTGRTATGATPAAAEILLEAISRHGGEAGLKVSGGVRTLDDAAAYLALADRTMGPGWAGPKHFRIGASGLLDAVLEAIGPGEDDDA